MSAPGTNPPFSSAASAMHRALHRDIIMAVSSQVKGGQDMSMALLIALPALMIFMGALMFFMIG
jgi:hypothetical protein